MVDYAPSSVIGGALSMYCPSCGKEIPDESSFCMKCGKAILATAQRTVVTTIAAAPAVSSGPASQARTSSGPSVRNKVWHFMFLAVFGILALVVLPTRDPRFLFWLSPEGKAFVALIVGIVVGHLLWLITSRFG